METARRYGITVDFRNIKSEKDLEHIDEEKFVSLLASLSSLKGAHPATPSKKGLVINSTMIRSSSYDTIPFPANESDFFMAESAFHAPLQMQNDLIHLFMRVEWGIQSLWRTS